MKSYVRILSDHLDTAGIEHQVLDLTSSRHLSVALVRTLYRRSDPTSHGATTDGS
jgi:hypothetical protein